MELGDESVEGGLLLLFTIASFGKEVCKFFQDL